MLHAQMMIVWIGGPQREGGQCTAVIKRKAVTVVNMGKVVNEQWSMRKVVIAQWSTGGKVVTVQWSRGEGSKCTVTDSFPYMVLL